MGACGSKVHSDLDYQLAREKEKDAAKIKLLLLGAGESGKSTIFKQMRILYGQKKTEAELMEFKSVIHGNVMTMLRTLVTESRNLGTSEKNEDVEALGLFNELSDDAELDPENGAIVKRVWDDPGTQATWDLRAQTNVVESNKKFIDDIQRISSTDFIPTEQDMLLARVRTTGIITESYEIDGSVFEMYDVGGQRNERKKWIHCFENVTAVIFVAALSEYNQKLFEDSATNRMIEALELFEEIASSPFFTKSSLLLFLNKKDLFESKISEVSISDTPQFSDYTGGANYDNGVEYFVSKFKQKFSTSGGDRQLYHHCTCATDTKNVEVVFNICKKIILENNLKEIGFM